MPAIDPRRIAEFLDTMKNKVAPQKDRNVFGGKLTARRALDTAVPSAPEELALNSVPQPGFVRMLDLPKAMKKFPLHVNPTPDDLMSLIDTSSRQSVRGIGFPKERRLFAWDADLGIHDDVFPNVLSDFPTKPNKWQFYHWGAEDFDKGYPGQLAEAYFKGKKIPNFGRGSAADIYNPAAGFQRETKESLDSILERLRKRR